MCNGWATCGKSTRFGSGKSRAVPQKSFSKESSWVMTTFRPHRQGSQSVLFRQKLLRIGPGLGGRVQGDDRKQGLVKAGVRRRHRAKQRTETHLHLPPELDQIQPE